MPDNCFPKEFRLLKSKDFEYLKYRRSVLRKKYLTVYFKKSRVESEQTRLGMSVSKKVGKANYRNYLKRIIREIFRNSNFKQAGIDALFVVSIRHKISNVNDFKQMVITSFKEISRK